MSDDTVRAGSDTAALDEHWVASVVRPFIARWKDGTGDSDPFEAAVDRAQADMRKIMLDRHRKYGPGNIANSPYGAKAGLIVRIWDKLARLKNNSDDMPDESVEDAWIDLANYALIGLLVQRGEWPTSD